MDRNDSTSTDITGAAAQRKLFHSNPHGVQYMERLWELVEQHAGDLKVVLRTDDKIFTGVPVQAWWAHPYQPGLDDAEPTKSQLLFDIPDEVIRNIQSQLVTKIMRRWFGQTWDSKLPEAHVDPDASPRGLPLVYGPDTQLVTVQDWATLQKAIRCTAKDLDNFPGGQLLKVHTGIGAKVAFARIQMDRLEVYIGHLTPILQDPWRRSLQDLLNG